MELLRGKGSDVSFYEPIVRGDPPRSAAFEGTIGEIEVHEILARVYRELGRPRYPDFVTGGPSFEVVTITENEVQARALRLGHAVAEELLRCRGDFTTAIYSQSMINPLLKLESKPLHGGSLLAGGELLIDTRPWQGELAKAIYEKIRRKAHKNRVNRTHSSVVVNLSRLTCFHPLILKSLLEGAFKPSDSSIDSVLLASLGQGTSMRLVYVRNRHASSPLDSSEIAKVELTELLGHPFHFILPTLFRHDSGRFDLLRGARCSYTIAGTEVNGLTMGHSLTAITGVTLEPPHNLVSLKMESGGEAHTLHFDQT